MKDLYTSLAEARPEIEKVKKDSTNPHFKSKFPSLDAINEASEEALSKRGLLLLHLPRYSETIQGWVCTIRVVHVESTQFIDCELPLLFSMTDQNPMQALGKALSYSRRYGTQAILNLISVDDDAEGAYPRREAPKVYPIKPAAAPEAKKKDEPTVDYNSSEWLGLTADQATAWGLEHSGVMSEKNRLELRGYIKAQRAIERAQENLEKKKAIDMVAQGFPGAEVEVMR